MSTTVPTPEPQLPVCDSCGNRRGPWLPSGDLYPSGAQVLVCSDGCAEFEQMPGHLVDHGQAAGQPSDSRLCGARRPGWDLGPAIGRRRIPCVRASHDGDGDHRNGLGETWPPSCQDCGTTRGPLEVLTISDPDGGLRDGHLCQSCSPPIDDQELEVTRVFARTTNFTMAEGALPAGELVRLVHLADGRSVVVVDFGQESDHDGQAATVPRCPAAGQAGGTGPCDGPADAVHVYDYPLGGHGVTVDGCELHAVLLLAALDGKGRVHPGTAGKGSALRVYKAAQLLAPSDGCHTAL